MSYRWPNKDPDEVLDYTIDWAKRVSTGLTITAVAWYIDDEDGVKTPAPQGTTVNGLTVLLLSSSGNKMTIVFGNGFDNVDYKISCAITLSNGNVLERSVRIAVKEF